jgi:hypothetical protein
VRPVYLKLFTKLELNRITGSKVIAFVQIQDGGHHQLGFCPLAHCGTTRNVRPGDVKLHTKFQLNRTTCSKVIVFYPNKRWRPPTSWIFSVSAFWNIPQCLAWRYEAAHQISTQSDSRFKTYLTLSKSKMAAAAIMDFVS